MHDVQGSSLDPSSCIDLSLPSYLQASVTSPLRSLEHCPYLLLLFIFRDQTSCSDLCEFATKFYWSHSAEIFCMALALDHRSPDLALVSDHHLPRALQLRNLPISV